MANYDKESSQIKEISVCFVKHKLEIEAAKQPHYLGPIDVSFLPFDQMQRGLLFSTKPKNVQSFLEKLKKSLSICLGEFYTLAGQFATVKIEHEHASWVYVDCNKGPGASIIYATAAEEITVKGILDSVDVPKVVRSFFDFGVETVNYDGHYRPLLSIQVTELVDGLFVGFTVNHSIGDGSSLWHFISTLSEIYAKLENNENDNDQIGVSRKPIFKPYFPEGCGPILKFPYLEVGESITRRRNHVGLRERIFHFTAMSISNLKSKANKECGVNNISSFQALSAFMWRSITRARNLEHELETCCALVMNARPRFNPPISNEYFGNFLIRDQSMCKAGELLNHGLGWAAMLVHQVVVGQDDKKVREFYELCVKYVSKTAQNDVGMNSPFYSPNPIIIGGSTRFDMYGPEFGLGKAEAALAGYSGKEDGKITASPGREGGGTVDLEVCLKPETMNALELDQEFMSFVTMVLF